MQSQVKLDHWDKAASLVLSLGALLLAAYVVFEIFSQSISKETAASLAGTVVGFVFGNMIGSVYRKVFGGPDAETSKNQSAQMEAVKSAVDGLSTSTPIDPTLTTITTPAPTQTTVSPVPKKETK